MSAYIPMPRPRDLLFRQLPDEIDKRFLALYDEVSGAGKVGTKEVDEADLGDRKIPVYDEESDKFIFIDLPTGSGGGAGFLVLPYLLWRTAFGSTFLGLIDVQMQISTDPTFADTDYDLSSSTARAEWVAFSGASGEYVAWEAAGMPATDITGIGYAGELEFDPETRYYMRWRVFEHGTMNSGDWIPGGVL